MQEHTVQDIPRIGAGYRPETFGSIAAAKEAQQRERAAFTKSTGIPLTAEGFLEHRAPQRIDRH